MHFLVTFLWVANSTQGEGWSWISRSHSFTNILSHSRSPQILNKCSLGTTVGTRKHEKSEKIWDSKYLNGQLNCMLWMWRHANSRNVISCYNYVTAYWKSAANYSKTRSKNQSWKKSLIYSTLKHHWTIKFYKGFIGEIIITTYTTELRFCCCFTMLSYRGSNVLCLAYLNA